MIFKTKYSSLYERKQDNEIMYNINVTPFIDVMLVLLIVFMISAPLLVNGVNINLPQNSAAPAIDSQTPFTLTVTKTGKIFYEKKQISMKQIKRFVRENVLSKNTRIYIRGDQNISYGRVMKIIAEINAAGYKKVSLVTESDN